MSSETRSIEPNGDRTTQPNPIVSGDEWLGTYSLLDLVPKGRDEHGLVSPMARIRHHDRYAENVVAMPPAGALAVA